MTEFSQIVFARVGHNSAVQGKVDIPEGAEKLIVLIPRADDNRSNKTLERALLAMPEYGYGVLIMELWDEEELCNKTIIESRAYLKGRVAEINSWVNSYKAFESGDVHYVGVDESSEIIKELNLQNNVTISQNDSQEEIIEKLKGI